MKVTTGIGPDLMSGVRMAVTEMVEMLSRRFGYSPIDAYMLCSVCADLRISSIVDPAACRTCTPHPHVCDTEHSLGLDAGLCVGADHHIAFERSSCATTRPPRLFVHSRRHKICSADRMLLTIETAEGREYSTASFYRCLFYLVQLRSQCISES